MDRERELLKRVLKGDLKAEGEFIALFRPRLLRTCVYLLGGSVPEAEEVVQKTFEYALPRLRNVPEEHLYTWLRQNCLRLCYAHLGGQGKVMAGPMSGEEELETE